MSDSKLNETQRAAREQFARQSHRYATGHILQNVDDVDRALAKITLPKKARVLDVATGAGNTGLRLAELGHDVTLGDIARPMLDRAQEAAKARGLSVQVREHTAEQFPYDANSFDLVTCRVAAHHFSAPGQFVSESARVLRPGGHLLVIDGSVQDDATEAETWIHQVEKLRDPSHAKFITPRRWREFCTSANLRVEVSELTPFKMPDLNWYFDTAATSPENRSAVLNLVEHAPASARNLFQLGKEEDRIVWWWQRLTLIASKSEA